MQATRLSYLTDPYATDCKGVVLDSRPSIDGGVEVILTNTVFHPLGGGQPADVGHFEADAETYRVTNVHQDRLGRVWHVLDDANGPAVGAVVRGVIDWDRRYKLMRTHTATHVTIAEVARAWEALVTGCEMGVLEARIDFDNLPGGVAAEIERMVNTTIDQKAEVHFEFLSHDAAASDPDLVRTKTNLIPDFVETVRVVVIDGIDRQADGGTHVRSTTEIGRVRIVKVENKGRGLRRVRLVIDDE